MPLPTCECVSGLPIGEQLAAIYCATYTLANGNVDGPFLLKAANLSDVADPTASRANISAAESGANTDITSLGGVLNIGVGGATPTAATYPKIIARATVNQTLTGGFVPDILNFGTEIVDNAGAWSTNSFTVPANAAGFYRVGLSGLRFINGATTSIHLAVYVNGVGMGTLMIVKAISGSVESVSCTSLLQLSVGDILDVRATQFSGTSWEVEAGGAENFISVNREF